MLLYEVKKDENSAICLQCCVGRAYADFDFGRGTVVEPAYRICAGADLSESHAVLLPAAGGKQGKH